MSLQFQSTPACSSTVPTPRRSHFHFKVPDPGSPDDSASTSSAHHLFFVGHTMTSVDYFSSLVVRCCSFPCFGFLAQHRYSNSHCSTNGFGKIMLIDNPPVRFPALSCIHYALLGSSPWSMADIEGIRMDMDYDDRCGS